MIKKTGRSRAGKAKTRRKLTPSGESAAFRRGVAIRGEAIELHDGQELPEGATHQIVGHDAEGLPIVKRLRFSLVE